MKWNEEKLLKISNYFPLIIAHFFYAALGLLILLDTNIWNLFNFLLRFYFIQMPLFIFFQKKLVKKYVFDPTMTNEKFVFRTSLLLLIGFIIVFLIGILIKVEIDKAPFWAVMIFWLGTTLMGMVMTFTYSFTKYAYNQRLQLSELGIEKAKSELKLFKSQINPHFLFNTLNNIYGLVHMGDPRAPKIISKLSQILRYMLYDCNILRISLRKERELIENYLQLQSLKAKNLENRIDFYHEGINDQHQITPLLLINLVENCFKHSDVESNELGWVKVSIEVDNNVLNFKTQNTIKQKIVTNKQSGIGLKNTKKILEAEYPEQYQFATNVNNNTYMVDLIIEISRAEIN